MMQIMHAPDSGVDATPLDGGDREKGMVAAWARFARHGVTRHHATGHVALRYANPTYHGARDESGGCRTRRSG